MLDWQIILHLNFAMKSSLFNEINNRTWSDFRKQFRHEGHIRQSGAGVPIVAFYDRWAWPWDKILADPDSTWSPRGTHTGWGYKGTKRPLNIRQVNNKRPDGLTLLPWQEGKPHAWDVTVICPLAVLYLFGYSPGASAELVASRKCEKYANLPNSYIFHIAYSI